MTTAAKVPDNAVENILSVYSQATDKERRDGCNWYERAHDACKALSVKWDVPIAIAAGVVAALSPNNRWERNLVDADMLFEAYMNGDDVLSVRVCTYHKMRQKAWDLLALYHNETVSIWDIEKHLKGQKIVCFWQNILGVNTCTIDGHARNIAYNERLSLSGSKFTIGIREYRALQQCYVQAAERVGLKAYELQAITWVVWRRIHNV